mgnify:FL=1|jgi:hypothetical protein|tara:strand:- start:223 stop:426 length:204 start_codon:yes stop_codon:yes gene_type:complete
MKIRRDNEVWQVRVQQHEWKVEKGSYTKAYNFIELPPECTDSLGWIADDIIEWHDNSDGTWQLKKAN